MSCFGTGRRRRIERTGYTNRPRGCMVCVYGQKYIGAGPFRHRFEKGGGMKKTFLYTAVGVLGFFGFLLGLLGGVDAMIGY